MLNLQEANTKLYDLLALDRGLRGELLQALVEKDKGVCFLLSLHLYFNNSTLSISHTGRTSNFHYQLKGVLEDAKGFAYLGLKEQVVLKEILNNKSRAFNYTIFYTYAIKVYNEDEIKKELEVIDICNKLPYLILPKFSKGSPYYFKTSTKKGTVKYNNIPKGYPPLPMSNDETIVVDRQNNIVGKASGLLGDYLKGTSKMYGKLGKEFKYISSIAELQLKVNKYNKENVALVLASLGPIILNKEKSVNTFNILDLVVNDAFEITGVYIEVANKAYKVKTKVAQGIVEEGINNYTVTIKYVELLDNKIKDIEFVRFYRKDVKDVND